MPKLNRKIILTTVATVGLLLFTSALHKPNLDYMFLLGEVKLFLVYLIYIGMISSWIVSISHRIMQKNILHCLLATASCMLFWIIARTLKYNIFPYNMELSRFFWYCYYIPMLLIPLLGFFASLCLSNDETHLPSKKYLLLFIPAALLIALVLTNDLHQWAFTLLPNIKEHAGGYRHGLLYFIAVAWIVLFELLTILIIIRKSRIPGTKKRIWAPFVMVGVGIVYTILYIINQASGHHMFIEMTVMLCFLTACIWESCIQTGMIPSNTRYDVLFQHSELAVQITDTTGQVRYAAAQAMPVDEQSFTLLKTRESFQSDENTELHAVPIRGGSVVWREDISQISALNRRLADSYQQMSENNYLLQKEIETKSKVLHIKEQTRLYKLISQETKAQLLQMEQRLTTIQDVDEEMRHHMLCEINVLATYIKRRGNLTLMAEEKEVLSSGELRLCLVESLENLKFCSIKGRVSFCDALHMPATFATLCYDLFEELVERELSAMTEISSTLTKENHGLRFTVEAKYRQTSTPWGAWETERLSSMGCQITIDEDAGSMLTVALYLPEGDSVI